MSQKKNKKRQASAEENIAMMNRIARILDLALNGIDIQKPEDRGKQRDVGFLVLLYPFNTQDGRANYITNMSRDQLRKVVKKLEERFDYLDDARKVLQ